MSCRPRLNRRSGERRRSLLAGLGGRPLGDRGSEDLLREVAIGPLITVIRDREEVSDFEIVGLGRLKRHADGDSDAAPGMNDGLAAVVLDQHVRLGDHRSVDRELGADDAPLHEFGDGGIGDFDHRAADVCTDLREPCLTCTYCLAESAHFVFSFRVVCYLGCATLFACLFTREPVDIPTGLRGSRLSQANLKINCECWNRECTTRAPTGSGTLSAMPHYPAVRPAESSPWINGDAQLLFNHYYSRLAGVAATRYRWEGLPDTIDPMRLEITLILQGGLAAFTHLRQADALKNDEAGGLEEAEAGRFTVMRATYGGAQLDDLFNPSSYRPYGPGSSGLRTFTTNASLMEWKGVPIWGDALRMNYDGQTIELFANRLARASLIVDTNMAATTRGVVVATDQDDLLTSQTILETTMSGIPAFHAKGFDVANIKALDLGVHPDTVERSHVVAMRLWNEALTALGVQAGAQEKEERLTDDEVQAIRGAVEAVRRRTLTPRQQAATYINRRYFGGSEIVKVIDQW